jgi:hypothetical protein
MVTIEERGAIDRLKASNSFHNTELTWHKSVLYS